MGNEPEQRAVTLDVVQRALGGTEGGTEVRLSPIQRAGLNLTWAVGAMIAITMIGTMYTYSRSLPPFPSLADANAKGLIENYKTVQGIALDNTQKLFDLLVTKALLPVFTTLIGYVIGTHVRTGKSQ